ncbi:Origin recognition complex subunit 4 [Amphibalanus amphitrite]|uniref:Origin recognition complex subunit 4 n=1 Tax=Amphibalanus amphitrite TaxID=1232801 RepID=A0A6A4XCE6_AMPAM|nr:Origin recognition complex subunit 4 [Amphibalanus amphitrite]
MGVPSDASPESGPLPEVLRRLQEHSPPPDPETLRDCYPQQWAQLAELVQRAAGTGESNSAIIVGPRGVGKTALLNCVLSETGAGTDGRSVLVRLHGLLQTDDRAAIRHITAQLKLESAVGDRVFGSFAENLSFLLKALRGGNKEESKTVVFVLEEFDLFCQHKNQTLLYNLFDVAQSAQAPICVLGLTARLDVLELMEKRVKSRFSHRQLYLYGVSSVEALVAVTRSYLWLPSAAAAARWNRSVERLLQERQLTAALRSVHERTRSVRDLKLLLRHVVLRLWREGRSYPEAADFTAAVTTMSFDGRAAMLQGLSVLELCLVVAMRHLTQVYDEPFNFEMVLREYGKFAGRKSTFQSFTRPVVMKAYENLQNLELIRPADGGASRGQKEYQLFWLAATAQEVAAAVKRPGAVPTEVAQWADNALI